MTQIKIHDIHSAYEMSFSNQDGIVAKLKWASGVLTHEGNLDISAEVFFDLMNQKGITQYNEMKLKIDQLERELSTSKTQNQIYRKALNDNR